METIANKNTETASKLKNLSEILIDATQKLVNGEITVKQAHAVSKIGNSALKATFGEAMINQALLDK